MKLDPFIEAEKIAGHSVRKTLLLCSRSPRPPTTSAATALLRARAITDAELHRADPRHPQRIPGHLWRPRGSTRSFSIASIACGKRKVTRLMREAGLEGRCKKRWRTTTVADPDAEAARGPHSAPLRTLCKRWTAAMSATSPTSEPGRAGPTWRRSSTWPAAVSSAGLWPITCAPSWSKTPRHGLRQSCTTARW